MADISAAARRVLICLAVGGGDDIPRLCKGASITRDELPAIIRELRKAGYIS